MFTLTVVAEDWTAVGGGVPGLHRPGRRPPPGVDDGLSSVARRDLTRTSL